MRARSGSGSPRGAYVTSGLPLTDHGHPATVTLGPILLPPSPLRTQPFLPPPLLDSLVSPPNVLMGPSLPPVTRRSHPKIGLTGSRRLCVYVSTKVIFPNPVLPHHHQDGHFCKCLGDETTQERGRTGSPRMAYLYLCGVTECTGVVS